MRCDLCKEKKTKEDQKANMKYEHVGPAVVNM